MPPASLPAALALAAAAGAALALAVGAALARHRRQRDGGPGYSLAALVERAPDAVVIHAPDGTALEPNAAARHALGLGDSVERISLLDVVALDDQPAARAHLATLAADGPARSDLRLRSSGTRRPFEVSSGRVEGRVLTIARDVGPRAERERQALAARDRAQAAARDKSAFLDSMGHELRTPLTAVLGFAELLRDEVEPESRGLVQAIETGGRRLLQTLDDVLDLARLDSGRAALRPVPLDAAEVVGRAAGRHRATAEADGLALRVEAPERVPATLDAGLLDRVVGTLVGRAVASTDRGRVTVEIVDDAATVTVRVLDTGPGIAPDVLPTLFDENRSRGAHPTPAGATALALPIARRLVDLAGGTISAESRWGEGSAFTVVLPRGPIPELAPAAA